MMMSMTFLAYPRRASTFDGAIDALPGITPVRPRRSNVQSIDGEFHFN